MLSGCVTFAAPPPLVTAGGAGTVAPQHAEVAVGVGTGVALFERAHSGGTAWMGRWRTGVTDRLDLGADMMGAAHGDTGTFNAKVAARYQLLPRARLEAGVGAADNSDGKSLSAEMALTLGSNDPARTWNRYLSLRGAAAKGYPENVLGLGPEGDIAPPPDALFGLVNLGTTGRISPNQRVFFEAGVGYIAPRGETPGPLIFWGVGLLADIGK